MATNVSLAHPSNRLTFTRNSVFVASESINALSNGEFLVITGYLNMLSNYTETVNAEIGSINIKGVRDLPFVAYNRNTFRHKAMMINSDGKLYFRDDGNQVKGNHTLNFAAIIPIF